MDDRKLEFGVGVLVLAAIGVSVILTFIFGAFPVLLRKEYAITAKFPSVAGINVDTPVMKNGVRIGRVKDIQLVNDNLDGGVHLVMMISERFPLKQGEGLAGMALLQVIGRVDAGNARADNQHVEVWGCR